MALARHRIPLNQPFSAIEQSRGDLAGGAGIEYRGWEKLEQQR
jgi:hypothetical protein